MRIAAYTFARALGSPGLSMGGAVRAAQFAGAMRAPAPAPSFVIA